MHSATPGVPPTTRRSTDHTARVFELRYSGESRAFSVSGIRRAFLEVVLPLYGLPPGSEVARALGELTRREVPRTRDGRAIEGTTHTSGLRVGLVHGSLFGAPRLQVLTSTLGASTPEYLLGRELGRRTMRGVHGAQHRRMTLSIDDELAEFVGLERDGVCVACTDREDHSVCVIAQDWELSDLALVRVTDLTPYLEGWEVEMRRRGAPIVE